MNAPLYVTGAFGDAASLGIALLLGVAFGWFLERGGMGSARKIAAQFYLTDLAVFKIMFSAILTTLLGLFWLSRIGWIDLALLGVPETFVLPHIAGGLVFGVGFVMGGLCPGTSCVAASTGRIDGLMVLLGMMTGILGFGFAYPALAGFYESGARGVWTLPQAMGLPWGAVVSIVVAAGLGGFLLAERIERGRPGGPVRLPRALVRGGAVAGVLGALALVAGNPFQAGAGVIADDVTLSALEVAEQIRARAPVRLIDVRDAAVLEQEPLPLATHASLTALADPAFDPQTDAAGNGLIVVVAGDDGTAAIARMLLEARGLRGVRVMRGGSAAWHAEVLEPLLAQDATEAERAAFAPAAELSRWFGGSPRTGVPRAEIEARARALLPGRLAAADGAVRRARRGCGF